MFFERTVAVARLSPDPINNDEEEYATIATGIKLNLQPATANLTAVAEGVYGQTYTAYTTYSGFCVGDQVSISGTTRKLVIKGVQDWNYGPIPHIELLLFEGDK